MAMGPVNIPSIVESGGGGGSTVVTTNEVQRDTAYAVGDIAYSANLPAWARLECVTAGTTGSTEPSWTVSTGGGTSV